MKQIGRIIVFVVWLSVSSMALEPATNNAKLLPFYTANIDYDVKLTERDFQQYTMTLMNMAETLGSYGDDIKKGENKAAESLQKGVSYDEFLQKALAYSGKQKELDASAQKFGYKDAVSLFLVMHRFQRALKTLEGEQEKLSKEEIEKIVGRAIASDIELLRANM